MLMQHFQQNLFAIRKGRGRCSQYCLDIAMCTCVMPVAQLCFGNTSNTKLPTPDGQALGACHESPRQTCGERLGMYAKSSDTGCQTKQNHSKSSRLATMT